MTKFCPSFPVIFKPRVDNIDRMEEWCKGQAPSEANAENKEDLEEDLEDSQQPFNM